MNVKENISAPAPDTISFSCNGKCRICPYPGALCHLREKDDSLEARNLYEDNRWISEDIEKKIKLISGG